MNPRALSRRSCQLSLVRAILLVAAAVLLPLSVSSASQAAGGGSKSAAEIQALIDQAEPDTVIVVPPGVYAGTLKIHKRVALLADGLVQLINNSADAGIHITADQVVMNGFTIIDTATKDAPTVWVEANAVKLERMHIRTASHGIKLIGARHGEIRDSTIVWDTADAPEVKLSLRKNGIDLYDAHENLIIGNTLTGMHDGIYIENSHDNRVQDNQVDHMRYGIHTMYASGSVISGNTGSYNITGAMVMAAKATEVSHNTFIKQSENVHSQGILLFDAHDSRIDHNRVQGNRVGMYVEMSSDNVFTWNRIEDNFIGMQFIEASANRLSNNAFTGNVIHAEARLSPDNEMDGNFWDSFIGIDTDGDGRSEITHAINPFYPSVVRSRPAFQLFFQSPSMLFLEGMFLGEREAWLADNMPLMERPGRGATAPTVQSGRGTGGIGVILILVALSTILYLGVRRT